MERKDDRLADEMAFHLEQQTAKLMRGGMSEVEARRAARLKFGGVTQVREATRDQFRFAWLRDAGRDLRIAFRALARVPSFSVTAILTIGLGIGAAAAMFTVVDGVLLRPLPYPDADRIVQLFQISEKGTRGGNVSEPNFLDWQAQTRGFAAMAETASADADRHRRRRAAERAGRRRVEGVLRRDGDASRAGPRLPGRGAAAERAAGGAGRGALLGAVARGPAARRRVDRQSAASRTRSSASCPTGSTIRSRRRCGCPASRLVPRRRAPRTTFASSAGSSQASRSRRHRPS